MKVDGEDDVVYLGSSQPLKIGLEVKKEQISMDQEEYDKNHYEWREDQSEVNSRCSARTDDTIVISDTNEDWTHRDESLDYDFRLDEVKDEIELDLLSLSKKISTSDASSSAEESPTPCRGPSVKEKETKSERSDRKKKADHKREEAEKAKKVGNHVADMIDEQYAPLIKEFRTRIREAFAKSATPEQITTIKKNLRKNGSKHRIETVAITSKILNKAIKDLRDRNFEPGFDIHDVLKLLTTILKNNEIKDIRCLRSATTSDKSKIKEKEYTANTGHKDDSSSSNLFVLDRNPDSTAAAVCTAIYKSDPNPSLDHQPAGVTFSIQRDWANSVGDLTLKKICDIGVGKVSMPLGCVNDSVLGFIFTGSKQTCSESGVMGPPLLKDSLNRPSALLVIKPGKLLAILDNNCIYVYNVELGMLHVVADNLRGTCRGLAITSRGYLVTASYRQGPPTIQLLDPRHKNQVVAQELFPSLSSLGPYASPRPCFMTSHGDVVYITDLGLNQLVCLSVNEDMRLHIDYVRSLGGTMPAGCSDAERLTFISGVQADSRYELLLADAKKRILVSLTARGDGARKVRVLDGAGFPYCSSFAVSPNGYLLACGRMQNAMTLFKFTKDDDADLDVVARSDKTMRNLISLV